MYLVESMDRMHKSFGKGLPRKNAPPKKPEPSSKPKNLEHILRILLAKPKSTPLTFPGPEIKNLSCSLIGDDPIEKLRSLSRFFASFLRVKASDKQLESVYAKRPANKIVQEGKIYQSFKGGKRVILGCVDYSLVAMSLLHYWKIPCKFVRENSHSYVFFLYRNELYVFDPFSFHPVKEFLQIPEERRKEIENNFNNGNLKIGNDPVEIGLTF